MRVVCPAGNATTHFAESPPFGQTKHTLSISTATRPTCSQLSLNSGWARFFSSEWVKIFALAVLFCWYPLQYMHFATVADPDVWWHMRTGEWILQHHAFPRVDPFSATGMGKPWVAYSWLFEVMIHLFTLRWDLLGIVIYNVVMCLGITAALLKLLHGITESFWPSVGLTFVGAMAMARVYAPRPGMFSTLLFIVTLDVLLKSRRTGNTRILWVLPALFAVWANLHVQFVYGLFIAGVFCVAPQLNRIFKSVDAGTQSQISASTLWGVLAASFVATLLNPYRAGVYRVLWEYSRQPQLAKLVSETNPMDFTQWLNWVALALAIAAIVALWKLRRDRGVFAVLLLWALVSALRVERDVWVLVIVACTVLGTALAKREQAKTPPLPRQQAYVAAAVIALIIFLGLQFVAPSNEDLLARLARVFPVGSVAYLHEHHPASPIFNDFNWGGFLIYAVPNLPPSIDGRTNVHGAQEIERSWDTWNMAPGWDQDPNLAKANIILGNPSRALTKALQHDTRYRVAFNDGVSVLFLKTQ